MDKTSFNVKFVDLDYLHLTAQTKETYFKYCCLNLQILNWILHFRSQFMAQHLVVVATNEFYQFLKDAVISLALYLGARCEKTHHFQIEFLILEHCARHGKFQQQWQRSSIHFRQG